MSYEPKILKKTGKKPEMEHLFSIVETNEETGEDEETKYYIPKKVPYNVTLGALDVAANAGELAAEVFAMKEVLGEDGYEALLNNDELEEEDFDAISEQISQRVLGKSNRRSRRASKKSRG